MDNKEENGPAKSSKPGSSTSKSQRKSPTSVNSLKDLGKLDSYNNEILTRIKQVLEQNSRVLLIMRGLPGSGKSTLAKQTVFNGVIVSADSYFTNLNGVYVYDQFKISDAHQSCKTRALEAMKKGVSPVVIDNTNIKIWEFQPYVSMGVKYKYHIELIEPNTPWKFKPKILSEKNIHGVNLNKIKNSLDDYDVNVDLKRLIEDCKSDLPPSSSQTRPKPKPGSIIGNFEEFANKVDWEISEYPSMFDNQSESTPKSSGFDLTDLCKGAEKTDVTEIESESKSELDKEAKELLNQMFPNVDDEILVDFLIKYDNNVARVTDILLDSICFEEIRKESDKPKRRQVKSLKTLCNEVMERLEIQFENLYENSSNVDVCFSLKEEEESIVEEISSNSNVENEPIFSFNLDSELLRSIIKIFGEKDEEKYLNDVNRVDIGINLAQQLYTAWKNTKNPKDGFVKSEKKLVKSKSEQTFRSQANSNRTDWEKDKEPSLREIMDEELAIEIMSKEMYPLPINFSPKETQTPKSRNLNERNYANLVKIDILKRKYEKIVDSQAIEEIFRSKEYDLDKTMQHIEEIFCLVSVKDPINRFDLSKKSREKSQENNQNADLFRPNSYVSNTQDSHKDYDKNRQEAQKHAQIRQDYFEKASEAHARGWGAVAQYYAEMGHFETKKIKSENQTASAKILSTNNTDMRISNTLDLHGLHVDEAISVLKKCLNEKRNEYYSSTNTKKRKTYIFVITGLGHHSKSGPKLRPNIINFLNQKGIRYNEPHIGLLKVDFLS